VPKTLRESFDDASLPLVTWLDGLPRAVPVLAVLGLLVVGAFGPSWGWVLTGVVAIFLAWVLAVSWPGLSTTERIMRVAVLAFIIAITVVKADLAR
jgi:hypothetical protein